MATTDDLEIIWGKRRGFTGADHPGLRLNNLTTAQRDALTGSGLAKAGDYIWNTTTGAPETYTGSAWSKAVIATSSGWQTIRRPVVEDGTAVVLSANDSGALCVFDKVDGAQFTLPAPAIGLSYDFIVVATVTSGTMKVITDAGTVFIKGSVDMVDTDTTFTHTNQDADGSGHIAVAMAATSTNANGGVKGTRFNLTCRTATQWVVSGQINHAGSVATPFSNS